MRQSAASSPQTPAKELLAELLPGAASKEEVEEDEREAEKIVRTSIGNLQDESRRLSATSGAQRRLGAMWGAAGCADLRRSGSSSGKFCRRAILRSLWRRRPPQDRSVNFPELPPLRLARLGGRESVVAFRLALPFLDLSILGALLFCEPNPYSLATHTHHESCLVVHVTVGIRSYNCPPSKGSRLEFSKHILCAPTLMCSAPPCYTFGCHSSGQGLFSMALLVTSASCARGHTETIRGVQAKGEWSPVIRSYR